MIKYKAMLFRKNLNGSADGHAVTKSEFLEVTIESSKALEPDCLLHNNEQPLLISGDWIISDLERDVL